MKKKCAICGEEFEAEYNQQKYCSQWCWYEMHARSAREYYRRKTNSKRNKKCAVCGKEFTAKHGREKYCSNDCRARAKKEYNKQYHQQYRKKTEQK